MTARLAETRGPADLPPLFRRFCSWVRRTGVLRVALLMAGLTSLLSLTLTWFVVRVVVGHPSMGNALWISILVPLPLALGLGGLFVYLVASLDRAWEAVNELAMQDTLTGLGNRRRFLPVAQRELDLAHRHQQALTVVVLDVDHFKSVNDTFGHLHGDAVLVEIARRCQHALRNTDMLARWGGEEFIMLLPNTPPEQALLLAERVREAIAAPPSMRVDGQEVQVTVSMGAAGIAPGQALSLAELIKRADAALYRAKASGRNQVTMSDADAPVPREQARTAVA